MMKCEICGKEFNNSREKQSLILHMERKHKMRHVKGEYVALDELEKTYDYEFRLLDSNDLTEKALIEAGYTKIQAVPGVSKARWEVK